MGKKLKGVWDAVADRVAPHTVPSSLRNPFLSPFLSFLASQPFLASNMVLAPPLPLSFAGDCFPALDMAIVEELRKSPLFFLQPAFIADIKRSLIPVPAACEGYQCACCRAPILNTDTPMSFYDDDRSVCSADCADLMATTTEEDEEACWEYEDAMDAYIDYVLDCDYDW